MNRGVVVLGMHRSGTSAMAGMLDAAGLSAGATEDLLAGDDDNEPGYFERKSVVSFHDEVLTAAGGSWFLPPSAEDVCTAAETAGPRWRALLDRLVEQAGGPITLKDPRMCVLPEVWRPEKSGLFPVLVYRHPVEVARSLVKVHRLPTSHAVALWEMYTARILGALHGSTIYLAPYADLLHSDVARRALVTACLGRCGTTGDVEAAVATVRSGLRHQAATDVDQRLSGHQSALHAYLEGLGAGEVVLDVPERFRRVSGHSAEILDEARLAARTGRHLDELHAALTSVQAALEQTRADMTGHLDRVVAAEKRALAQLADATARVEAMQSSWAWRIGVRLTAAPARVRAALRD